MIDEMVFLLIIAGIVIAFVIFLWWNWGCLTNCVDDGFSGRR